jgi:hypothetical protein
MRTKARPATSERRRAAVMIWSLPVIHIGAALTEMADTRRATIICGSKPRGLRVRCSAPACCRPIPGGAVCPRLRRFRCRLMPGAARSRCDQHPRPPRRPGRPEHPPPQRRHYPPARSSDDFPDPDGPITTVVAEPTCGAQVAAVRRGRNLKCSMIVDVVQNGQIGATAADS